jgi:hypothetical protein
LGGTGRKITFPIFFIDCQHAQWPAQPALPPTNTEEGIPYLQELLSNPEDFADFLRLAKKA